MLQQELLAKGGPKKVFLFGYMRGGTTLLNAAFDKEPKASVWYEPFSQFYGGMFGLPGYRVFDRLVYSYTSAKSRLVSYILDFAIITFPFFVEPSGFLRPGKRKRLCPTCKTCLTAT
jgi:hypothetical protein